MIPNDEYVAISKAPPDEKMDSPRTSSFWRRRAALMLGMYDRNAPWVDIIGAVEYAEYGRDKKFAGELALRHLRIEVGRLEAKLARVRELHTDSLAGVCPSCARLNDVSDTDDGLVAWPCPTILAIDPGVGE